MGFEACDDQIHTPGDWVRLVPKWRRAGMIGVEEKTKGEMNQWLSYL